MRRLLSVLVVMAMLLTLAGTAVAADYGPSFPFMTHTSPR